MRHQPTSTFFATVDIENGVSVTTESDGDLWPTAWDADDALYTFNGDGKGFDLDVEWSDIVLNRIEGTPETGITGERITHGAFIASVWGDTRQYNRKPTGALALDGNGDGKDELYVAVQDLKMGLNPFDDAPNACVYVSENGGEKWSRPDAAMFTEYQFTTIMFLDFGQSHERVTVLGDENSGYAYAYGMDNNWRDSFTATVKDPQALYLARVPIDAITNREAWTFFAGLDGDQPTWDADIAHRQPVLEDTRRVYEDILAPGLRAMSVISQGSIVYNAPLERYIYSSWTEYTWEMYEAPQPWGPWTLFAHKDFGVYPWMGLNASEGCPSPKNGGYGTVIPSKFISNDGKTMWVQSNWWGNTVACGDPTYKFAMRRMTVEPFVASQPDNTPDPKRNLALEPGSVPIEYATHFGRTSAIHDDTDEVSEDSWNGERKVVDFWGVTWPRQYTISRVTYTVGDIFPDGGWFASDLRVQVRQQFVWTDVELVSAPDYPFDASLEPRSSWEFTFDPVACDGVRIIGVPGGDATFTSIAEFGITLV